MLRVTELNEANRLVAETFVYPEKTELIHMSDALGRVLAQDLFCGEDVPGFDRSVVDGYAVRASETFGAGESISAELTIKHEINMGDEARFTIDEYECAAVATGGMLPGGADAVVMKEYTERPDEGLCLIYRPVSPFENVTKRGDDVKENELLLKKGTVIAPHTAGVLAAAGIEKIPVRAKPSVGILSTGDELVPVSAKPAPGQIRDVNTYLLSALAEKAGCRVQYRAVVKDDHEALYNAVREASEQCDIVLLSGGSSAGDKDMTARVVSELGEVLIHGLAMKPGKPTVIGRIGEKAVFGLPGHPAAAYFVFLSVILPLIRRITGDPSSEKEIKGILAVNVPSNHGREEFICVRLENGAVTPLYSKSGIISMLSRADGYIRIDRNTEGLKAGDEVTVHGFL